MVSKSFVVLCLSALLVQCINGCPCGGQNLALSGCGRGASLASPVLSSSGGVLAVTSYSPLSPSGISVASDAVIEGALNVIGALPYVSAVAFEGQLPSAGSAGVSYSCGDNVAITSAASGSSSNINRGASAIGLSNLGSSNIGLANLNAGSFCGCGANRL